MSSTALRGILQQIHDDGGLTPERVVEEARAIDHPLHSRFEWDDSIAGEAYRRSQAADLIRSVKVVFGVDAEGRDKEVRGFVSVRPDPSVHQRIYRPIEDVIEDPLQRQILLRDCLREWKAFEQRYGHLEEFIEITTGSAVRAI